MSQDRGEIKGDAVYTLQEFENRTGLKRHAMRTARQNGLKVVHAHGRVFIHGRAWLDYIAKCSGGDDEGGAIFA